MTSHEENLERAVAFTWRQVLDKPQPIDLVHGILLVRNYSDMANYTALSIEDVQDIRHDMKKYARRAAKQESIPLKQMVPFYALDSQLLVPPKAHVKKYGKPLPFTDSFFRAFDRTHIETYSGDDVFEGRLAAEDQIVDYSVSVAHAASREAAAVLFVHTTGANFELFPVADYGITEVDSFEAAAAHAEADAQRLLPSGKIQSRQPSLHERTHSSAQSIELVAKLLYDANRTGDAVRATEYATTLWRLAEHTPYEAVVTDIVTTLNKFSKTPKRALRPVLQAHFNVLRAIDSSDGEQIQRAYARVHEQVRSHLFGRSPQ